MATAKELIFECQKTWKPPKKKTLSDWSDEHAYLSAESSAQEGRWKTLIYQKDIMNSMTDSVCEMVVLMKSARVGYTKMLNNLIGYHIHQDPCSMMVVQPTIEDAEGYSKEEIAPMIRDTNVLKSLVSESKSKDSNNTILSKSFPGGILSLVGANSPRGFRRVSRRIVLFDEVDGYPPSAGTEGDQIKLGIKRTEYYWNRKIVIGSTPTDKQTSRIEKLFLKTDQRRFFVPCPECNEYQYLKWGGPNSSYGIKWDKDNPSSAFYLCEHCGCAISHDKKYEMMLKGEWRATAKAKSEGAVGYHIWAAYSLSPNATWANIAAEFLDSKGDPLKLKTFVNTVLAETWEEKGERVESNTLTSRCEVFGDDLPEGCHIVTCGVDVQKDRIELEYVGWGRGEETWSLGYEILKGDPNEDDVWHLLDIYLGRTFRHASGVNVRILMTFVDSGNGNHISRIYDYCRPRSHLNIFACKGASNSRAPICSKESYQKKAQISLYLVGGVAAKDLIYGRLALQKAGPGYMHFPVGRSKEWFDQLTSEEAFNHNGERMYKKIRARNEGLDCRVYATGAMYSLGLKIDQIADMIENSSGNNTETQKRTIRDIEN